MSWGHQIAKDTLHDTNEHIFHTIERKTGTLTRFGLIFDPEGNSTP